MGQQQHTTNTKQRVLNVATLYYSKMILSPFQFFNEKQFIHSQELNHIFMETLSWELPEFIGYPDNSHCPINGLDKDFQDRFTPLYQKGCGITPHFYLMNKKEFYSSWDKKFDQIQQKMLKKSKTFEKVKENKKKQLRAFDYCVFKTLLIDIYGKDQIANINQKDKNIQNDDFNVCAIKYIQKQQEQFGKSYLNQEKRAKLTIKTIFDNKLDILFLVDVGKNAIDIFDNKLQGYRIIRNVNSSKGGSLIFIRQQSFPEATTIFKKTNELLFDIIYQQIENEKKGIIRNKPNEKQYYCSYLNPISGQRVMTLKDSVKREIFKETKDILNSFNINDQTLIQILGNFILICPQLTSKKQKKEDKKQVLKQQNKIVNMQSPQKVEVRSKNIKKDNRKKSSFAEGKENKMNLGKTKNQIETNDDENKENMIKGLRLLGNIIKENKIQVKQKTNQSQIMALFQLILRLKKMLPKHHFIIGGLINGQLKNQYFEKFYNQKKDQIDEFFEIQQNRYQWLNFQPKSDFCLTSSKIRTLMQPQRDKAFELVQQIKDYLLTDLPLQAKVINIRGKQILKDQFNEKNRISRKISQLQNHKTGNKKKRSSRQSLVLKLEENEITELNETKDIEQMGRQEDGVKSVKDIKGGMAQMRKLQKFLKNVVEDNEGDNEQQSQFHLLPDMEHPYTSYMVIGKITIPS